jgi:hypothetical protein
MVTRETTETTGTCESAITPQSDKPYGMSGPGETPTSFEQMLYRNTAIRGWSLLDTSSMLSVDHERIEQAREKVQEWRINTMPRTKLSLADQQVVIDQLAIERLEYLYSEATEAWRESRKEHSVTRQALGGGMQGTTTSRIVHGRASLLVAAVRIVIALAKYQTDCLQRRAQAMAQAADSGKSPPFGACSPLAKEQVNLPGPPSKVIDVSDCKRLSSDESKRETFQAMPATATSAQPVHAHSQGGGRGVPGNAGPPARPKPR